MVKYYEDLTPEQQADQAGRQTSYDNAMRCLADPAYSKWLHDQIAALDAAPPAARLQPGEFLERVTRGLADGPPKHLRV